MLLQVANRVLINNREKTYLTAAAAAGDVALTVASTDLAADAASSNTWKDNDYMIVGEPIEEGSEVMQISTAVTTATSLTVDREGEAGGLRHSHPIGTPVYRIAYNRARYGHNTSDTEDGIVVLTTIPIQPDDEFTRYEDTANATGYGFIRFNNQQTGAVSNWSDGVNYEESGVRSSRDPRTLRNMREKVKQLLGETEPGSILTDDMIDDALNDKQREIAHIRLWTFYEGERSFSSIANQFAYNIPSTVQKVHGCLFDTQPLSYHNRTDWDLQHFDTDQSASNPGDYTIWDRQVKVHPRPSSSAGSTTLSIALTDTATTVQVAAISSFNRGDYYRFIIGSEVIYATFAADASSTLSADLASGETTTCSITDTSDFVLHNDYYKFKINDEVIYATDKTSTTFTTLSRAQEDTTAANHTSADDVEDISFDGLLRGREGTDAASHLVAADVTERDIVYTCHVEPDGLFKIQERTAVPEPEVLTYGAAIDLAPFVDKKDMIKFWQGTYDKRIKDLKDKYSSKQTAQPGRIKDMNERLGSGRALNNSNLYPRDVG